MTKLKEYKVRLWAHLPASATMIVKAESEQAAIDYALENHNEANWDGADYQRPDGSQVETAEIIK